MELPTSVIVPVTPFVDGREVDLLVLAAVFVFDLVRLELDDARGVEPRFAELRVREGRLLFLRLELAEFALGRVLVWAMVSASHLPHFRYESTPCPGYEGLTPALRV